MLTNSCVKKHYNLVPSYYKKEFLKNEINKTWQYIICDPSFPKHDSIFYTKNHCSFHFTFYFSADGNFEVTLATKATILDNGKVEWKPPAIYHSSCEMDVEYFPFDEQTCVMKFGSWTYDGGQV